MKLAFTAALLALAGPAFAEDKSVDYAYMVCQVIDGTGFSSSPCEVSGWHSTVTANVDMSSSEARDACSMVVNLVHQKGLTFSPGWTLQFKSPYSGDKTTAYCPL